MSCNITHRTDSNEYIGKDMLQRRADPGAGTPDMDYNAEQLAGLDGIFILHSYRSGSNYVASIFESNGFGRPAEYFNGVWQASVRGFSKAEVRERAVSQILEAARNGVFACKAPMGDFCCLTRAIGDGGDPLGALARRFRTCSVVLLERENIFLQAISLWRASVTGEWFRYRGANEAPALPDYDEAGIYERYLYLARESFLRRELVQRSGIAALRLTYEEVVSRPEPLLDALETIADRIDPQRKRLAPAFSVDSAHVQMRDEASEIYRERFVRGLLQSIGG